jgi:hypothetical protein
MFITCAITRWGIATASSGDFHQMYLLAQGFNASQSSACMAEKPSSHLAKFEADVMAYCSHALHVAG